MKSLIKLDDRLELWCTKGSHTAQSLISVILHFVTDATLIPVYVLSSSLFYFIISSPLLVLSHIFSTSSPILSPLHSISSSPFCFSSSSLLPFSSPFSLFSPIQRVERSHFKGVGLREDLCTPWPWGRRGSSGMCSVRLAGEVSINVINPLHYWPTLFSSTLILIRLQHLIAAPSDGICFASWASCLCSFFIVSHLIFKWPPSHIPTFTQHRIISSKPLLLHLIPSHFTLFFPIPSHLIVLPFNSPSSYLVLFQRLREREQFERKQAKALTMVNGAAKKKTEKETSSSSEGNIAEVWRTMSLEEPEPIEGKCIMV